MSNTENLRILAERDELMVQLAAAQAVIAECGRLAGQIMFDRDAEPARTAILDVTRRVGTEALKAHNKRVSDAAWKRGYDDCREGKQRHSPYREQP